jgi:hypothetical protein
VHEAQLDAHVMSVAGASRNATTARELMTGTRHHRSTLLNIDGQHGEVNACCNMRSQYARPVVHRPHAVLTDRAQINGPSTSMATRTV